MSILCRHVFGRDCPPYFWGRIVCHVCWIKEYKGKIFADTWIKFIWSLLLEGKLINLPNSFAPTSQNWHVSLLKLLKGLCAYPLSDSSKMGGNGIGFASQIKNWARRDDGTSSGNVRKVQQYTSSNKSGSCLLCWSCIAFLG